MHLTWTKNPPDTPGYFWKRILYKNDVIWSGVVEVFLLNNSLYSDTGSIITEIGAKECEEWAGPIKPPN